MKVAISGFGRIGKSFLKAAVKQDALGKDFEVVAINTRSAVEPNAHLFKYDSVYGPFQGGAEAAGAGLGIHGGALVQPGRQGAEGAFAGHCGDDVGQLVA